jgi:hypothetical protein
VLLSLFGCTTLSTMHGAKTIEPKTWEIGIGSSVQQNNAFSAALGIPVPQLDLSIRYGLRDHVDIGTRIYTGGLLTDVRYQFWEQGEWTFAISPGVGGLAIPVGGVLDLRIPIKAQRSLGPKADFITGVVPIAQNTFVFVSKYKENYMNNYIGSFVRFQYNTGGVVLGTTFDLLDHSSRGINPSWNWGFDISFIRKK